jgi:hypothetical protein
MVNVEIKSEHDMEQVINLINLRSKKLKLMEISIYVPTLMFADLFMENLHKDMEEMGNNLLKTPLLLHFIITAPLNGQEIEKLKEINKLNKQENESDDSFMDDGFND